MSKEDTVDGRPKFCYVVHLNKWVKYQHNNNLKCRQFFGIFCETEEAHTSTPGMQTFFRTWQSLHSSGLEELGHCMSDTMLV